MVTQAVLLWLDMGSYLLETLDLRSPSESSSANTLISGQLCPADSQQAHKSPVPQTQAAKLMYALEQSPSWIINEAV